MAISDDARNIIKYAIDQANFERSISTPGTFTGQGDIFLTVKKDGYWYCRRDGEPQPFAEGEDYAEFVKLCNVLDWSFEPSSPKYGKPIARRFR